MLCWEKSSTFCVQSIDIDPIPCYGTTHADYFYGEIPCVRCLTKEEINSAYEENTGHLIVSEFKRMKKDVMAVPAVLCKNHGPFSWGKDAKEAIHNAVVLEEVAKMAYRTELIHPQVAPAPQELQDKHYFRKHGANAITDRINRISRGYKTDEDENSTYGVEQLGLLWSGCYRRYRTTER
mgnify:CR=1 FL=1